jgi:hypothetical protein
VQKPAHDTLLSKVIVGDDEGLMLIVYIGSKIFSLGSLPMTPSNAGWMVVEASFVAAPTLTEPSTVTRRSQTDR